eukprot:8431904-Karenia_brevis.AAC.1
MPRAFQYARSSITATIQPPGIIRQVYDSMGELRPMAGYTYYNRILAVCYNLMQQIPRDECNNWVAL